MSDETAEQHTVGVRPTDETGSSGDPSMTRRDLFAGAGQVAIAGMSVSSLALIGACATAQQEPWEDGTLWTDGTGWIA